MEGTVMTFGTVLFGVLILLIVVVVARSVALIPQGEAAVIERLGRYTRTVSGGLTLLIPFIDRIRAKVDTRERVFSFPPQAVITQDNLTVAIDTVVTFQVNEPERAIYGVDNYIVGVEQISTATLRDVVGAGQENGRLGLRGSGPAPALHHPRPGPLPCRPRPHRSRHHLQ